MDNNFENRFEEFNKLQDLIEESIKHPVALFIRSDTGMGKSRLIKEFLNKSNTKSHSLEVSLSEQSYSQVNGYLIRLLAKEFTQLSKTTDIDSLKTFLLENKNKLVGKELLKGLSKQYPSLKNIHKKLLEGISAYQLNGKFSEKEIFKSNESYAVKICRAYVEEVSSSKHFIITIGDFQNIDLESLRYILQSFQKKNIFLICEYTCSNYSFNELHDKEIEKEIESLKIKIHDLKKIEKNFLENIVESHFSKKYTISDDFHKHWDGNIRSLKRRKNHVSIDDEELINFFQHRILNESNNKLFFLNNLSRDYQVILSIILKNQNQISITTLLKISKAINPKLTDYTINIILQDLISKYAIIQKEFDLFFIKDLQLKEYLNSEKKFLGINNLTLKYLRDYYMNEFKQNITNNVLTEKIYNALKFSAEMDDYTSLNEIKTYLADNFYKFHDQPQLIEYIYEAFKNIPSFEKKDELLNWAIEQSYEIGHYEITKMLIMLLKNQNIIHKITLVCCNFETGNHDEVKKVLENNLTISREFLLLDALSKRFDNQHSQAKEILFKLTKTKMSDVIQGYAKRFTEMVVSFTECTDHLEESIEIFDNLKLFKSKAYTLLALSMHLIRQGEQEMARKCFEDAENILNNKVYDKHLLQNNKLVLSYYSNLNNYDNLEKTLIDASYTVREDFSLLTIQINLSIVEYHLSKYENAIETLERAKNIVENPNFGDKDIFIAFYYNYYKVLYLSKSYEKASKIKNEGINVLKTQTSNLFYDYWSYRFNLTDKISSKYKNLIKYDFHPIYLSHWLIDYEGILMMTQESS